MVDVFAHFLIVQLRIFSVNMVGALHNLFVNSPCGISRPVAHEPCRRHAADIRASFHQKGLRPFPRSADGGSPAGGACSQNQYVHRVVYRRLSLRFHHIVFFHPSLLAEASCVKAYCADAQASYGFLKNTRPPLLDEGLLRTLISPLCAMFLLLNRELSAVYGPAFTIRAVLPSSSLIF